jgi:hypothetical protein
VRIVLDLAFRRRPGSVELLHHFFLARERFDAR